MVTTTSTLVPEFLPQGWKHSSNGAGGPQNCYLVQWSVEQEGTISILEMKNTKVIYWKDFATAVATSSNAAKSIERTWGSNRQTLLCNNAVKQAAKYSKWCLIGIHFILDFSDSCY